MKFTIFSLSVAAMLSLAGAARADVSITLNNASFEDPSLTTPNTINQYNSTANSFPGWTSPAVAGVLYPSSNEYASVPDGKQVAFTDSSDPIAQTLSTPLEAGTYTLTVAVGSRGGGFNFGDGYFGLFGTDGTPLAVQTDTVPATGTFLDESVQLVVPQGSAEIGQSFQVELGGVSPHTNATTDYDNVRLTFASVPEPSTWVLLFGGAAALGAAYRFRALRS